MPNVFISYSREDIEAAVKLVDRFRGWYSPESIWFDETLRGDPETWQETVRQIAQRNVFVLFVTSDALRSRFCQAEIREAMRLHKPIVSLYLEPGVSWWGVPADIRHHLRNKLQLDISQILREPDDLQERLLILHYNLKALFVSASFARPAPLSEAPTAKPSGYEALHNPLHQRYWTAASITLMVLILLGIVWVIRFYLPSQQIRVADLPTRQPLAISATSQSLNDAIPPQVTVESIPLMAPLVGVQTTNGDDGILPATQRAESTPLPVVMSAYQEAIVRAYRFRGVRNREWQPFSHVFPDDESQSEMVLVPVGCFSMGNRDGDDREQPRHQQCVSEPFWIDRYEVNNEDFGTQGCKDFSNGNTRPRNCVSWEMANRHCQQQGKRLPTEIEWEYAARGVESWVYPWGDTWDANRAVHRENSSGVASPVGEVTGGASWVGAYDMSGNLWEWMGSSYEDYPINPATMTADSSSGAAQRVLRGGGFLNSPYLLRSSFRDTPNPDIAYHMYGFRCARSLNP